MWSTSVTSKVAARGSHLGMAIIFSRDMNCRQRFTVRVSTIRRESTSQRGKKVLNNSRDTNGGVYRSGEGGEEPAK